MVKEFVLAWERNKENLESYLKTHRQEEYDSYEKLLKLLFDLVINYEAPSARECYCTDDITVINQGDCQGILIFVLHKNDDYPDMEDWVYTHVYYGSCSGCDTLMHINDDCSDCDKLPTENQVKDYMTLCLHLLQRCIQMKDGLSCLMLTEEREET